MDLLSIIFYIINIIMMDVIDDIIHTFDVVDVVIDSDDEDDDLRGMLVLVLVLILILILVLAFYFFLLTLYFLRGNNEF